jgi:hypothetical protein
LPKTGSGLPPAVVLKIAVERQDFVSGYYRRPKWSTSGISESK